MSTSTFSVKVTAAAASVMPDLPVGEAHRIPGHGDRTQAAQLSSATGCADISAPRTLPHLLRMLDVADEPVTTQLRAIVAWLANNQVSAQLWTSMLVNGYGVIIERMTPGFQRPVPRRPSPPQVHEGSTSLICIGSAFRH